MENVRLQEGALEQLMRASGGDMRKALTFLQSCRQLSGEQPVSAEVVTDVSGQMPSQLMTALWTRMSAKPNRFDAVKETVDSILAEGYPLSAILSQLHTDTVEHATLVDTDKALICEKLAQADQCLIDGACESLQFLDVAAFITRRFTKYTAEIDSSPMVH